jgi:hypothetical protein
MSTKTLVNDSSDSSNGPDVMQVTTRLRLVGVLQPLDYENGLAENVTYSSDLSPNEFSDTDSDTSDDDIMYSKRERFEVGYDEYCHPMNRQIASIPSYEDLVSTDSFQPYPVLHMYVMSSLF